jgi:hypothetical protein
MRNNPTLAALFITVAVIVPAGWHALDADIQTDGKRLRPLQQSFLIGDTRVILDVDRTVVMTGDTVTATLVAFSDTPRQVKVDLLALHSSNYEGARVEAPWTPFDRETLKLTAAPRGGTPVKTRIQLGTRPDAPALDDDFKIYVTAHGKKPPRSEAEDSPDYDIGITEGYAAGISINGWSGDNLTLAMAPEGRPSSDAPFTIAVRVKNTSGQELTRRAWINLSTEAALAGTEAADHQDAQVLIEKIESDTAGDETTTDAQEIPWKRGEVVTARFRVTPRKPGLGKITFLASATEMETVPGPTTAGARDARTFTLSDAGATVAVNRPRAAR